MIHICTRLWLRLCAWRYTFTFKFVESGLITTGARLVYWQINEEVSAPVKCRVRRFSGSTLLELVKMPTGTAVWYPPDDTVYHISVRFGICVSRGYVILRETNGQEWYVPAPCRIYDDTKTVRITGSEPLRVGDRL